MGLQYFFILLFLYPIADSIKYHSKKSSAPLVETKHGSVVGKYVTLHNSLVTAFLGIPYAKPPIGEKRFAKPEPIEKWEKTIRANRKSPTCEQFSSRDFEWIPKGLKSSEDCLYLNIWTPVHCFCNTTENLPVLIWFYGGGLSQGSASMAIYDGSVIAAYGNVVVVSMNFRLGSFGFLNSGTEEAPGNVGHYDQILAMKWIKENIHNFGGDPNAITLFGESAGALSISNHMISPLSNGLFHRGIMESGSNILPNFIDDYNGSLTKANNFSKLVGCSNETQNFTNSPEEVLKCMKNKNASELAHAENTITSKNLQYFSPWFGNEVLPENPRTALKSKNFPLLPILIGTNKDEATVLLNYAMPDIFPRNKNPNLTLPQAKDVIKEILSSLLQIPPEEVLNFYFKNINENNSSDILKAVTHFYEDVSMHCLSLFFAENWDNSRLYWFTHRSRKDTDAKWMGVPHFYEVQFVFGKPIIDEKRYTAEDKRFSRDLIHKWANFARTGNPLPAHGRKTWPKLSPTNPMVYELRPNSEGIIPHPRSEACEFWRPYLAL